MSNEIDDKINSLNGIVDAEQYRLYYEEYRNRKLKEELTACTISSLVHILLLVLAIVFVGHKIVEENSVVVITTQLEKPTPPVPPPPPPPPEPPPVTNNEANIDNNAALVTDATLPITENPSLEPDPSNNTPSTNDNSSILAQTDLKSYTSPTMSAITGGRSPGGQIGSAKKHGVPTIAIDKAVKGLDWLAKVQSPDGSWGAEFKYAYTGLALMCYLARGETPNSTKYGKTVKAAISYLIKDNGSYDANNYSHAIRTYALAEAYIMTGDYALEPIIIDLVKKIIAGQNAAGYYDYNYKHNTRNDMSYSAWNYQALHAVEVTGIEIDGLKEAIAKSVSALKKSSTVLFPYTQDTASTQATRSAGMLCLQLYGEWTDANGKPIPEVSTVLQKQQDDYKSIDWNNPARNAMYTWYYQAYSAFQTQGDAWSICRKKIFPVIMNNQNKEGSWNYPGTYHGKSQDEQTNKIHATTFAILILAVPYRFGIATKTKSKVSTPTKDSKEDKEIINL